MEADGLQYAERSDLRQVNMKCISNLPTNNLGYETNMRSWRGWMEAVSAHGIYRYGPWKCWVTLRLMPLAGKGMP